MLRLLHVLRLLRLLRGLRLLHLQWQLLSRLWLLRSYIHNQFHGNNRRDEVIGINHYAFGSRSVYIGGIHDRLHNSNLARIQVV